MTNTAPSVSFASVLGQAPDSPLDVPEILAQVSSYLTPRDVYLCLFVNRSFNVVFARIFWRHVQLGLHKQTPFVTLNSVGSNSHMVQSLHIFWEKTLFCGPYLSLDFGILNELRINAQSHQRQLRSYSLNKEPAEFLRRHLRTIQALSVTHYDFEPHTSIFWKIVDRFETLSMLALEDVVLSGSVLADTLYGIFAKPISLRLIRVRFMDLCTTALERRESSLKAIETQGCYFDYGSFRTFCRLLKVSVALRVLIWGPWTMVQEKGNTQGTFAPIAAVLARGLPWKELNRLDICRLEVPAAVKTFKALTQGVPDLMLSQVSLSEGAMKALLGSFACNLTMVRLEYCEGLESSMVHDLLCSCSNLVSVSTDTPLLASSVLQSSAPWVCTKLEEWKISIEMDEGREDEEEGAGARLIFERLSQLAQLRVLNVSSTYARLDEDVSFLTFREDQGVRFLGSLQEMKVLNVRHTRQEVSRGEWEWLLQTFRGLKNVVGLRIASGEEEDWKAALAQRAIAYSR